MSYGKSFYEKKIKYLDYFEGQMRFGGGGFAKLEVREGKLRVDMTVTGLHATDTFSRDVVLCGKGRERVAGRINLTKGRGQYRQQWQDLEDIGGTGISYGELQGIRIPLGAGREVSCRWQETEMPARTQSGSTSAGGKSSGAGYVQEAAGASGKARPERRKEERAAEAWNMGEKAAAERYIAEEDMAERYRIVEDTGAGRTEEMDRETGYGRDEAERGRRVSRIESDSRDENGIEGGRSVEDGTEGGWQSGETEEGVREGDEIKGGWHTEDRTEEGWQKESETEERGYEGSEEQYDGSEEREQRAERKEAEKELADRGLPERELSEWEKAAVDRWKIEEDTETGTISRESEIKAMEGGRGEIAGASDRGEIRYGRERYAADEKTKSQANGAYGMDSSRLGGYMAEGGRKNQGKAAYGTEEPRPGGYAAEDGIRVQENDRYGMDGQRNMWNRVRRETVHRKEDESNGDIMRAQPSGSANRYGGENAAESGNGYGDRRDVGSRTGNGERRNAGSRTGYGERRDVESRTGNEDRKGAESGNGYGGRWDTESRTGHGDRRAKESIGENRQGEKPIEKQMKPMEDKWPQLWAIYPHIRPFQDEREYLSIGPADFVLFPAASYKAVNNSFLLHGYYNYKHLILARVEKRGDVFYYIGVPGNFYEREKQVAIMFGFESFECAEEPAQAGDFGYYMMRTEL